MLKNQLNRAIFILIIVITVNQADAKYYYGLSSYRVDRIEYKHSLKQYDSESNFSKYRYQSIGVGIGRALRYYFSEDSQYLLVYLTKGRKESDELLVYTTVDFKEIYRLKVGKFSRKTAQDGFPYLYPPIFVNDSEHVLVQTQQKKGRSKIESFRLDSGQSNYSIDVEKGYEVESKSLKGNLFYVVKKVSGIGGFYTVARNIIVYNTKTGEQLNTFEMEKSYKFGRKLFTFLDDSFSVIVSVHKKESIYKYRLLVLNIETGKVIQEYDAGGAKPIQVKIKKDDGASYLLLAKKKKLEIVKFEDSQFQEVLKYEDSFAPKNFIINFNRDKFLITGRSKMVLIDKNRISESKEIKLPFDIGSGFFSANDDLVFIKEGYGSEVGVIDFKNKKLINSSGTGRKFIKLRNMMAMTAGALVIGYYNPNYFYYSSNPFWFIESGTSMLLTNDSKKLYVINKGTNDVSIFNSKDLSNKKIVSTGNGTLGVFQLNKKNTDESSVFVLSEDSISYFDNTSNKPIKAIKYRRLLSIDIKKNLLFVEDKKREVQIYYLDSGEYFKKMNKSNSLEKIFYFQN